MRIQMADRATPRWFGISRTSPRPDQSDEVSVSGRAMSGGSGVSWVSTSSSTRWKLASRLRIAPPI